MEIERKLAEFVTGTRYEDLPQETTSFVKNLILGVIGASIAGVAEESCCEMMELVKSWGGKKEATIWTYEHKVPAHSAAFLNSIMARALDYDDELSPGLHFSASVIPTAFAAAEMTGGCSGKDFLVAVILGSEVAARLNLCSRYEGFDPTGIVAVFGAAAAAGRIAKLDTEGILNALALAFNKSGGSFQCGIDGALLMRATQGFVSQGAIICVQLARAGITGPPNFIEGIYGYGHLYGNICKTGKIIENLGITFDLHGTLIKKYPSCVCTLSATEAALELVADHRFLPEEVERIDIRIAPYCNNLVGHEFKIGCTPHVKAQFNIQYCVANAILRRDSKLPHFKERYTKDARIMELVRKCFVTADPDLQDPESVCSLAAEVRVTTKAGDVYSKFIKNAQGMAESFPGNTDYIGRFEDCLQYSPKPLSKENAARIVSSINRLEEVDNVCDLIPLLVGMKNSS